MTRILVVEDDPALSRGLVDNLSFEGYDVVAVASVEAADEPLATTKFDVVLLDLMLPGASGFELLRTLPADGPRVIVVSARDGDVDVVRALDLGARDYVRKPFALAELLARVRSQVREGASDSTVADEGPELPDDVVVRPGLCLSPRRFRVERDGQTHLLSHQEAAVLACFIRAADEPLTRADLLRLAWDDDAHPTQRTIDNFVLKLRRKLEDDPTRPRLLQTVHGLGYVLRLPEH